MIDKKQIAIHESGHITLDVLWEVPWRYAKLYRAPSGCWGGVVECSSYQVGEVIEGKEGFVKAWTVLVGARIAEEIYLNKRYDSNTFSLFCSSDDVEKANALAMKYLRDEHACAYFLHNARLLIKQILKQSWHNCVEVIAADLCKNNMTAPAKLKPLIVPPQLPNGVSLAEIIRKTPWK